MDDEDGYFGEAVAAAYDGTTGMFAPDVVDATADFLAGLAGAGRAVEFAVGTGQTVLPWRQDQDEWVSYSFDTTTQAMQGHYVTFTGGRGEYSTIPFRYVWPAELDLMAQLAGLRLRERWDNWARHPFTHESRQHVSVWEKQS